MPPRNLPREKERLNKTELDTAFMDHSDGFGRGRHRVDSVL
jgi:hypothetical protein